MLDVRDSHNKYERSRNREIQGVCQNLNLRTPTLAVLTAQHKSMKKAANLFKQWCGDEEIRKKDGDCGDKKLSDLGEKTHPEREEPATSTKQLFLDKLGIGESSLVPGSPPRGTWNHIECLTYLC